MHGITLSTGTVVDTTGQDYQSLQSACFVQAGKTIRFDTGPAAVAVREFFAKIGNELVYRSLPDKSGEWRYWNGKYWAWYDPNYLDADLSLLVGEEIHANQIDLLVRTVRLRSALAWDAFDREPILTLDNLVVRLDGPKLAVEPAHRKEDYSTFQLPLPWQVAEAPHWRGMLDRMLPDPQDQRTLQEVVGAIFFPSFRMQAIAAFVGKAGAGKSTVAAVIRDMLGLARTSSVQACQLSGPHTTRSLLGKFANFDSESEYVTPEDEVILKQISGGDLVHINPKNKDGFDAVLPVKWVMVCEQLPTFSSKTDGFWQRLVVVPFDVPLPPDQQVPMPALLGRLRPEYPGIFHWAMKGLTRLLKKTGTRGDAYTRSARSAEVLAAHRVYSNPFLDWLEQATEPDPDGDEVRTEVYQAYRCWMYRRGHQPVKDSKFHRMMLEAGFQENQPRLPDGRRPRTWRGLRLRSNAN